MRFALIIALALAAGAYAQTKTENRLSGLEKRVTKVEKRVTKLEGGGVSPSPAVRQEPPEPVNPIAVVFLRKVQQVGKSKAGIRLYLEFENLSRRRLFAFNGMLVFKDEKGAVIWRKPYGHTEPLAPGEKVEVSMGILTEQAREYLKFVKARSVTAELEKQEVYGAE